MSNIRITIGWEYLFAIYIDYIYNDFPIPLIYEIYITYHDWPKILRALTKQQSDSFRSLKYSSKYSLCCETKWEIYLYIYFYLSCDPSYVFSQTRLKLSAERNPTSTAERT